MKRMIRWLVVLTGFITLLLPAALQAQDGEALFKANCTSCHNLYKKVTGPALLGAVDRWEGDKAEMEAFIKNSQEYLKSGRPKAGYANKLYEEYNKTVMTAQALKPEEIQAIIGYIEKAPPPPTVGTTPKEGPTVPVDALYSNFSTLISILLLCSVLVVFGIAVVGYALKARDENRPLTWENFQSALKGFFTHRLVFTVIVLVVLVGAVNSGYRFLWMMNLHNGYQPVQPIPFSHKLHAGAGKGQLGINCQYCHTGAAKGKSATIPATSVCMNCHNVVEEGSITGKDQIAKIRASYEQNKPIEWVRIHNLPDFVYFNHSQHVTVAGLECQECHGPVEEMEEVYQHSRLSMGWCIKCHREKEVDLNKSEYYKTVHANVKNMGDGRITVEKLGGTECARCHY